jgi:hypothetical protein
MTQTYSPRRTAEQWQALVTQWQQSGQSAKDFCIEQHLGYASFCQWRKRLLKNNKPMAASDPETPEASFIDLTAMEQSSSGGWRIVLSLGNGVELSLSQR